MKTGRTLTDLAAELDRQANTRRDYIAPTQRLGMFVADAGLNVETKPVVERVVLAGINGDVAINGLAHGQLAEDVGIPKRYYDRMLAAAPNLLAANVNHWFTAEPRNRLVRTLDGRARAWLSERYRPLDNYDLANAVLPTLMERGAEVVSAELTEKRMYLKAILPSLEALVPTKTRQRGDIVQAGIAVSNSEVGSGSLRIEPLLYILSCTNGAVAQDLAVRKYHVGRANGRGEDVIDMHELLSAETRAADEKAFWLKIRDVARAAFDKEIFARIVERATKAAGLAIESKDIPKVVDVVAVRFGLSETSKTGVLRHLIDGGDLSAWGLSNAITRQSQDEADYETATDLEVLGGKVIELPPTEWRAISRAE